MTIDFMGPDQETPVNQELKRDGHLFGLTRVVHHGLCGIHRARTISSISPRCFTGTIPGPRFPRSHDAGRGIQDPV